MKIISIGDLVTDFYYKNEKFYKEGFIDGYNFLLELQKEKRNDTNE